MKIIKLIKKYGLSGAIKYSIKQYLGINKQQEAIDSVYFYLNTYLLDTRTIPPTADENLRIMQLCDVALLKILDRIFKKHQMTYWLDFGTLLGAHRHKGFIPWDDDLDISMPREDYDKLLDALNEELDKSVFDIVKHNGSIGVGYMHLKTGIWCDIFPVDTYKTTENFETAVPILKNKIAKYVKFYQKNKNFPYNEMQQKRQRIINDEKTEKCYEIIYHSREFPHNHPNAFYLKEDIYPIANIEFEGFKFAAPANLHTYLKNIYGKNYMSLPKGGILHHDEGRKPLSTWAQRNQIDMQQVKSYLNDLAIQI